MNEPGNIQRPAGFDFNYPTIVAGLYILSFLVGFTSIIGLVLCYVWRSENPDGWEASHYTYHIRTFWYGLLGGFISFILMFVLIGFLTMAAIAIWILVRSVVALLKAQKQEPIADPKTLFI
jgi:uncharacterized membrane protein